MTQQQLDDTEISSAELGQLLGLKGQQIYNLAKAGILARGSGDRYRLVESVKKYTRYLNQQLERARSW